MNRERASIWMQTALPFPVKRLKGKIRTDVAIIGGGVTGLTAAVLLKAAGKKVALIDKGRIASGETSKTTAHLTEALDARYHDLISDFGLANAKLAAASKRSAIDRIEQWVHKYSIACSFKRVPGFLYAEPGQNADALDKETVALKKVGAAAELLPKAPLPFLTEGAIRLERQARIHPGEYLLALALSLPGHGCEIFEESHATDIEDGTSCRFRTENGEVEADQIIIAAHAPISNRFCLHTKIAASRSYAIAVRVSKPLAVDGLFWDTADPYHYIRQAGPDVLIIGGKDHKTGMEANPEECTEALIAYAKERFPVDQVLYQWSGQILETVDGLPYIGKNSFSKNTYVATGFSGNGMTFGTLSGMILSDLILKNKNPYAQLYDATRVKPIVSALTYVSENKDFPVCFIKDRIQPIEAKSLSEIRPGEGKILSINGQRSAVYVDERGGAHATSAICPHLGCYVRFNKAESSWDCPCHGSRFDIDGKVINGPSVQGLRQVDVNLTR